MIEQHFTTLTPYKNNEVLIVWENPINNAVRDAIAFFMDLDYPDGEYDIETAYFGSTIRYWFIKYCVQQAA